MTLRLREAEAEARAAATEEITRRLAEQHASELAQVQIIAAESAEAASSSSVKEHELAIEQLEQQCQRTWKKTAKE